jgi:hypothetical protein
VLALRLVTLSVITDPRGRRPLSVAHSVAHSGLLPHS